MTLHDPPPHSRAAILSVRELAAGGLFQVDLLAPRVAAKARPGQFVIVEAQAKGARISLPIAEIDAAEGRLALVFRANGLESLRELRAGQYLEALLGPVGRPSLIERVGTVALVGLGVEAFCLVAIARAFREAGNRVLGLVSAEADMLPPLAEKMAAVCTEARAEADGLALIGLLGETLRAEPVSLALAAGPVPLLRAVREMCAAREVRTRLRVSPLMLDGAGLCGGCRVRVGGRLALCCLEGAEFDAAELDLDYIARRQCACHI